VASPTSIGTLWFFVLWLQAVLGALQNHLINLERDDVVTGLQQFLNNTDADNAGANDTHPFRVH
jgi:hypothetical protein